MKKESKFQSKSDANKDDGFRHRVLVLVLIAPRTLEFLDKFNNAEAEPDYGRENCDMKKDYEPSPAVSPLKRLCNLGTYSVSDVFRRENGSSDKDGS